MKKKAGYSNTFIYELINDKADRLAFYFIINGYDEKNKILEDLYNYITNNSIESYNKTLEELSKNYSEFKDSYNFQQFSKLIYELNKKNNIYKYNYGTEGHIIKFLINSNSKIFHKSIENYISNFSNDDIKSENNITIEDYFNKIGTDIAIYKYIYNDSFDIYLLNKEFKEKFILYYHNFSIYKFEQNIYTKKTEYQNYKLNFEKNDEIKKNQEYFNILKYGIDISNDIYIIYKNTVILNFEIPKKIYKDKPNKKIIFE
jgi:hypothetical protein